MATTGADGSRRMSTVRPLGSEIRRTEAGASAGREPGAGVVRTVVVMSGRERTSLEDDQPKQEACDAVGDYPEEGPGFEGPEPLQRHPLVDQDPGRRERIEPARPRVPARQPGRQPERDPRREPVEPPDR